VILIEVYAELVGGRLSKRKRFAFAIRFVACPEAPLRAGKLYQSLGSATTTDDIEAEVSQLSENQIRPVLHFGSVSILSEPLSNGQVTPRRFEMPFTYTPSCRYGDRHFTVFARKSTLMP
jgi:hypothetical protein